jgi:hypothetical protein
LFVTFGLASISGNFVFQGFPEKLFTDCDIFDKIMSKQELLSAMNTEEARLISAQLYLKDREYDTALKQFEELSKSDNLTIAVNADFCRGMMLYHNKSYIKMNKNASLKLLKDSMYNGYFTRKSPAPEIRKIIIPKDKIIRSLRSSTVCENLYEVN